MWTLADEEEWNRWNRSLTSGVCYKELSCKLVTFVRSSTIIHEVNLNPDKVKINMMRKEKNRRTLTNFLNKVFP